MNTHLTEDELILDYYGETERADESRVESHLASCAECQFANQQLRQVMTLVDSAAPVQAPPGFERIAWARLEPALDANTSGWGASHNGMTVISRADLALTSGIRFSRQALGDRRAAALSQQRHHGRSRFLDRSARHIDQRPVVLGAETA